MHQKFNFKIFATVFIVFFSFWASQLIAEPSNKSIVDLQSLNNNLFMITIDNFGQIIMFVLIVYLLSYYIHVLHKLRVLKGTIIPLFEPPKDLSPAAVASITTLNVLDEKLIFSAVVVDLAIRGFLKIKKAGDVYTIQKIKDPVSDLPIEEFIIFRYFFKESDTITFDKSNGMPIEKAITEFSVTLRKLRQPYFSNNFSYIIKGVACSVVAFRLVELMGSDKFFSELSIISVFTLISLVFLLPVGIGINNFFKKSSTVSSAFYQFLGGPFQLFVGLAIFGTIMFGVIKQFFVENFYVFLSSISGGVVIIIHAIFFILLQQPTVMGRKIIDEIDGFKLFLSVTEKDRYKILSASEIKADIFEKYLPYAIALGVEGGWNEQLKEGFIPNWYENEDNKMQESSVGGVNFIGGSMHANLSKIIPHPKKLDRFFRWKQW